jgi:LysR family transcriptional regulator, regulator of abg operon
MADAAALHPWPDPTALLLLAEIADAGSVTGAARRLGLSQSAVSKQLRRLEDTLGVCLFERGRRGIQPTEYGQALMPRARAIRAQAQQAGQEIGQRRGLREGRLEIALSHLATISLLPRVVPAFRQRWPHMQLAIVPPTFQLGGLREGRPDFAVMSLPAETLGTEYSARPLLATTLAVVARPGHPLGDARTLAELRDAQWVLPSLESSVTRGLARAFRQKRLGPPHCAMTCQTLTGLELLATHTDLLAAMPAEVFVARVAGSGLRRVPVAEPIDGPRLTILRWADGRPTPAAADLEEAFVEEARRLAKAAVGRVPGR